MDPFLKTLLAAALGALLIDLKTYHAARAASKPGESKPAFEYVEFGLKLAIAVGSAAAVYFGVPVAH